MTLQGSQNELAGLRARVEEARARRGDPGEGPLLALVDEVVLALGSRAGWAEQGAALVALGGYGRAELSPRSDVDLLFLYGQGVPPPSVEAVLYPLWDLGFDVGHAFRTPAECGRVAAEDLTAATALLDARLLAGDPDLLEEAKQEAGIRPEGSRHMRSWIPGLARDVEARRARFGEISHLLEPHVKEGRGGLRDYQAGRWVLACLGAAPETVRALAGGEVREAYDFLLQARSALHRASRRKTDHLTFDFHRDVALEVLPNSCMADFFGRLHRASHRISGAWAEISALALARPKRWSLGRGADARLDGGALVRELRAWVKTGEALPLRLRRALSQGVPQDVAAALETTVANVLRAREGLAPLLTELHEIGLLGLVLPELEKVIHHVQYDASQAFTTGVHCIETLRVLEELWLGVLEKEEAHLTRLAGGILRPWTARVAALCHDLGKAEGTAEHAERGAAIARTVSLRLGFTPEEAEETATLVAAHGDLPAIAFGRDLEDPATWEDARRAARSPEALDALVALAFADLNATHPGSSGLWSGWRRDLLLTLAARARAEDRQAGTARRERIRAALGETGSSELVAGFEGLWRKMPVREALQMPPDLVGQLLALSAELGEAPAAWRVAAPGEGLAEILGVAHAAPRLLSSTLAALTSLGFDLLSLQVHAWPDGTVHLWFRARPGSRHAPAREIIERLTRRLSEVCPEPRPSAPRLANPRAEATPVEMNVRLLEDGGPFYTALQVRCRDRKGLLRDLAICFERLGLTITYALVTTVGPIAQDVFHLQDVFGGRVEGQEKVRALLKAVEEVASGSSLARSSASDTRTERKADEEDRSRDQTVQTR